MRDDNERGGVAKMIIRVVLVIIVIVVGLGSMKYLRNNGPEASKDEPVKVVPVVETMAVTSQSEQLFIKTQGSVAPGRRTQAASEVLGRVVKVSSEFKAGGVFVEGDMMLEIDGADYVSALASAESALADAKLAYAQEEARASQAKRDWAKLGRGEPSDLVLRKPQIKSAQARILAAEATVGKAERDLERTKLRAPYDCRVESAYTDLGSYISPGMRLADLHSIDSLELRVPVTLEDLGYFDSPEVVGAEVSLSAEVGGDLLDWKGAVVRSEGQVDRKTMTMSLVVSIYENMEASYPFPPVGLFVNAEIKAKILEEVVIIPRSALRVDNTILTLKSDETLEIMPVKLIKTLDDTVIISSDLQDGLKVIISPLEVAISGMQLKEENPE